MVIMLIYKHPAYEQTTTILRIMSKIKTSALHAFSYYSAFSRNPTPFYIRAD